MRVEPGDVTAPRNLLVVSDLHFGETLVGQEPRVLRKIVAQKRAFCRFLKHYGLTRGETDTPWRLVIAGDMIDFLRASVAEGVVVLHGFETV